MNSENGKILFVCELAGFQGGIERYTFNLAKLLRSRGYEVWFAYSEKSRNYEEFAAGFDRMLTFDEAIAADEEFKMVCIHKCFELGYLQKFIRRFHGNLTLFIHDHDTYCPRRYYYFPVGRINCRRRYCFGVCSLCGMVTSPHHWSKGLIGHLKNVLIDFPNRMKLFKQFDRIITPSEFIRQNMIRNGFDSNKIIAMFPPIAPAEPFERQIHTPRRLLFIGQFLRGKGADYFLRMLTLLKTDFHADLVGDGPDRPMLEKLVKDLHLETKVTFRGWLRTPEAAYRENDLLILPQRWQEPIATVGLEAANQSMAIAAFDVGGLGEYVIPGKTGILVKSRDVEAMAQAVDKLLADPEKLIEYGRNGHELMKQNTVFNAYLTKFLPFLK